MHVFILFQTPFSFRLLQNIEQSSLCYTVGSCSFSILNPNFRLFSPSNQTDIKILYIEKLHKLYMKTCSPKVY